MKQFAVIFSAKNAKKLNLQPHHYRTYLNLVPKKTESIG